MFSIVMKSSQPCARMVDQCLIATFRAASPPLIWQYDLAKNHSFSVTVQGEEGKWSLGVAAPHGDFTPIAQFRSRAEADEAFAVVERAMKKPRGSIRQWFGCARNALLIALFLLIGLSAVKLIFGGSASTAVSSTIKTTTESQLSSLKPESVQTNVPQVADDVLKMPTP